MPSAKNWKRNAVSKRTYSKWKGYSLGPPDTPRQSHVVISRLLRRLLQEAWNRGYFVPELTQDGIEFERRVRAALDVSRAIESDEPNESLPRDPREVPGP